MFSRAEISAILLACLDGATLVNSRFRWYFNVGSISSPGRRLCCAFALSAILPQTNLQPVNRTSSADSRLQMGSQLLRSSENLPETVAQELLATENALLDQSGAETSPFGKYGVYVARLETLMGQIAPNRRGHEQIAAALNGQGTQELRRIASRATRQQYGTYFTGIKLSVKLVSKLSASRKKRFFYDPTCGMGDLLLAAAKTIPIADTLPRTLARWGHQLAGTDLHAEFVHGTKIRLMLLARQLHHSTEALALHPKDAFPHIFVGNGLDVESEFERANTLLMNPPYGLVPSPSGCLWAGGRVTEAATFMVTALERVQPTTEIVAILPDVLRSGSFSERWRETISELAEIHLIKPCGIFDDSADIDVFLLRLTRRVPGSKKITKLWPKKRPGRRTSVGTFFNVHVGRVVPHRDPNTGPEYVYIHPRCVPPWEIMTKFLENRKYEGKVYKPPFVAIRRTSRPGHPYRATATVIGGRHPVAVENHFIVCEPKDGMISTCTALMSELKTEAVNQHLNTQICCRHLTVGAVSGIPFKLPSE